MLKLLDESEREKAKLRVSRTWDKEAKRWTCALKIEASNVNAEASGPTWQDAVDALKKAVRVGPKRAVETKKAKKPASSKKTKAA